MITNTSKNIICVKDIPSNIIPNIDLTYIKYISQDSSINIPYFLYIFVSSCHTDKVYNNVPIDGIKLKIPLYVNIVSINNIASTITSFVLSFSFIFKNRKFLNIETKDIIHPEYAFKHKNDNIADTADNVLNIIICFFVFT